MFVMVFETTYDVFGPFSSVADVKQHLIDCGYERVSENYWRNGDSWVHIKSVDPPRK